MPRRYLERPYAMSTASALSRPQEIRSRNTIPESGGIGDELRKCDDTGHVREVGRRPQEIRSQSREGFAWRTRCGARAAARARSRRPRWQAGPRERELPPVQPDRLTAGVQMSTAHPLSTARTRYRSREGFAWRSRCGATAAARARSRRPRRQAGPREVSCHRYSQIGKLSRSHPGESSRYTLSHNTHFPSRETRARPQQAQTPSR